MTKAIELPRPILKWPGSKRTTEDEILSVLPRKIRTYYEPFFGGGSVFFALARQGRFERAVLNDKNLEIVELYRALRTEFEAVEKAIKLLGPGRITREKYNRIRASKPRTRAGRAARTLFLNKTCYNGLYRVNKSRGEFNVPWGKRTRWRPDWANLQIVSMLLRGVLDVANGCCPKPELHCRDFALLDKQLELFGQMGPGDAAYFDPPYLPESKTARFSEYTSDGFTYEDHKRLAELFARLASQGVHVVASNAAVRGAERLYEDIPGTKILEVEAPRAINSNGKKRGKIAELLIVNPGTARGKKEEE